MRYSEAKFMYMKGGKNTELCYTHMNKRCELAASSRSFRQSMSIPRCNEERCAVKVEEAG